MPENDLTFSVVITTYNRAGLLLRAVNSAMRLDPASSEVIIVDDASTDETQAVASSLPGVRYFRQTVNGGPGPARDRGLREARASHVVLLDDDDELLPGALAQVRASFDQLQDRERYPVVQFATNGQLNTSGVLGLIDYWEGRVKGDFTPVVFKSLYLSEKLRYPTNRVGGEHLLWWEVAQRFGLPTWNEQIVRVHVDAQVRLTSAHSQVRKARDHLALARSTLEQFGAQLQSAAPALYRSRLLALGIYGLLSGEGKAARTAARSLEVHGWPGSAVLLRLLMLVPRPWLIRLFLLYRGRLNT